jgi:hypothetical protein
MTSCALTSVPAYQSCECANLGLASYGADPNDAAIKAAVASAAPSGVRLADFKTAAEAMVRAGGLCYFKTNPGDCGSPSALPGITSGQIAGLSGSAASGVVGGLGAAGIIGGAATLGISAAISVAVAGIEGIFAHHAQAVANEQSTICSVMNYFNPAKHAVDAAVASGQITPDEGITYFIQVANQAKNGLQGIMKSCNAACWYVGFVQAFINYARTWYDFIAPPFIAAQAPGGPPATYGTPPGGVGTSPGSPAPLPPLRSLPGSTYLPAGPSGINALGQPLQINATLPSGTPSFANSVPSDYLNLGYNQQTGQSAQRADVPNTIVLSPWILVLFGLLLFLLVRRA